MINSTSLTSRIMLPSYSFNHCSKLELEKTGKGRLETQVARLREVVERQGKEAEGLRAREKSATEEAKKATKQWREVCQDNHDMYLFSFPSAIFVVVNFAVISVAIRHGRR